jgi:Electron transfer DM13
MGRVKKIKVKKFVLAYLVPLLFLISACTKNTTENEETKLPTGTVLASGNFISNSHPTSGSVKVIQDAAGKKHLVFENFRSDNGPDLDVWLSPGTSGNPYQSLGDLKAVSGTFSYELDNSINYTANNSVLIWCVDFSVLFGHAVLR